MFQLFKIDSRPLRHGAERIHSAAYWQRHTQHEAIDAQLLRPGFPKEHCPRSDDFGRRCGGINVRRDAAAFAKTVDEEAEALGEACQ